MKPLAWIAVLLALPVLAAAPPAWMEDARIETGSGETPARAVARIGRGETPEWVAWSVAAIPQAGDACCWSHNFRTRGCSLTDQEESWGTTSTHDEKSEDEMYVLVAVRNGRPSRVRIASPSCEIHGKNRRVVWLGRVDSEASIEVLGRWIDSKRDVFASAALAAIAYHAGARADALIEKLALDRACADDTRKNAIFWAGNARGEAGHRVLERLLADDPDGEIRQQALFAMSQSGLPEAVERIKRAAREDREADVRAHAFFCLSQTRARDAGEWIVGRLDEERNDHVREQAVFALSQLPDGTDWLLRVLRSKRDPETLRRALFWLAQSDDPRALEEIEKILD